MCRRQLQDNLRNQEQTKTFNVRDMRRSDDSGSPVQYRARNGSPLRKSSPKRNIWLSGPKPSMQAYTHAETQFDWLA